MGLSSDNIHGLILAVSSSIFIGSSFIIKKKGLMKAGASGTRAGLVASSSIISEFRFNVSRLIVEFHVYVNVKAMCS